MRKKFNFGKVDGYGNGRKTCAVDVEIELKENENGLPVFTASGSVWNNLHTDSIMGGQCLDSLMKFPSIKNNKTYLKIYRLWKHHHLNNMNAGTPEQSAALKKYHEENGLRYDYTKDVEYLKSINLWEVMLPSGEIYKYGHGWLYREIPENDLKEIKELLNS